MAVHLLRPPLKKFKHFGSQFVDLLTQTTSSTRVKMRHRGGKHDTRGRLSEEGLERIKWCSINARLELIAYILQIPCWIGFTLSITTTSDTCQLKDHWKQIDKLILVVPKIKDIVGETIFHLWLCSCCNGLHCVPLSDHMRPRRLSCLVCLQLEGLFWEWLSSSPHLL